MAELAIRTAVLAFAALLAGCGEAAAPGNAAAPAGAKAPEPATPEALAQRLIRQRLRSDEVRFEGARAYRSGAATVVCGTYAEPGRPLQRFVAVGDVDVWLEPDMAPGQMDRAFAEFCRDGAANA
jgi:hypothetical protein